MSMKKELEAVVEQIRPSDKKLLKEVNDFIKKLNAELKVKGIRAKTVMGGSIAKDTYLKGDHDCDLFVRFHKSYADKDISKLLGAVLKPFRPVKVHGSRDYYHIKNGINYEIVPVLEITDAKDAVNVTDMSPMHVTWVKDHPGLTDEIRLAKQFCKASGVYGAESYIKGFSGHVLDILVIQYGGFVNFLKATQKWKDKEVIDPEKHYKKDALQKLNRSKIDSPIIVIDPVCPERNAAAALSGEKLDMLKAAAAKFLKEPSKDLFVVREKSTVDIKTGAGKNKTIMLEVTAFRGKEDVVGAKLLKAFQQIHNQLRFYDFEVIDAGWKWNKKEKALFWYVLDPKDLIQIKKWIGPPLRETERIKNFESKHGNTFVEDGRVCTYVKRKYVNAEALIDDIIKDDEHLYEKVKRVVRK
ncbi:MAG: CCA tRNA nucleotidyltransferase [Candidatus Woesearchaeota archaeon]